MEVYGDLTIVTTDLTDCRFDEFVSTPDMYKADRIYVRSGRDVECEEGEFLHINL